MNQFIDRCRRRTAGGVETDSWVNRDDSFVDRENRAWARPRGWTMSRHMRVAAGCVVLAALLVGGQTPSIASNGDSGQRLQTRDQARTLAVVDMLGRPKD